MVDCWIIDSLVPRPFYTCGARFRPRRKKGLVSTVVRNTDAHIMYVGEHCFIKTHNTMCQGEVTPIDSVQTPATGVNNGVKQSKPKIWKVKRSKAHRKLEKVKCQAQLKVNRIQNLIKARYHTL